MKKHIFGIALFCSIVASFALIYAFIYTPVIPQIEEVKQVENKYEMPVIKPYSCKMKREKVSFEVLSSEYFYDENKIVTEVKLKNISYKPEKVFVNVSFSQSEIGSAVSFGEILKIENPFTESNEKIVRIVSNPTEKFARDENLYVWVNVKDFDGAMQYKRSNDVTQTKAVLFVHGKSSIIKK